MSTAEQEFLNVKARSTELSLPFTNLASAFMVEEALRVIAGSYYRDHFILRNSDDLSLAAYRRKIVHELSFYYNGSFALRDLAVVLTRTLIREKQSGIDWEMGLRITEDGTARVLMKGDLSGVSVPFELVLTPVSVDFPSREVEHRLFFYPDRRFSYLCYPKEQLLLDAVLEILLKMELIYDMSCYDRAYHILCTETVDGRHIREGLWNGLFERKLTIDPKRLNMLLNYRDYSYMKKKWKTYLRGAKKEAPDWGELMDLLGDFLTPLWDALCKDEVFFGDWMPELHRYI